MLAVLKIDDPMYNILYFLRYQIRHLSQSSSHATFGKLDCYGKQIKRC